MPNIHNLTFNLENYGLKNQDKYGKPHIFYPIDEPHGMIKVCLSTTYILHILHIDLFSNRRL
jgi:hypothetical protein